MNDEIPVEPDNAEGAHTDDLTEARRIARLAVDAARRAPLDVVDLLDEEDDPTVAAVLEQLEPRFAMNVLLRFPSDRQNRIGSAVSTEMGEQWSVNQAYPVDSVGRLMVSPQATVPVLATVADAVERIRQLGPRAVFSYGYVIDDSERLVGLLVMRDLLIADESALITEIMLRKPFKLQPEMEVSDALSVVVHRHYPSYPVCDASGVLLGVVQAYRLFEERAVELSAQSGQMVGVDKEEHTFTPWRQSLRNRHPWLQLNLLTAFLAAFVVGIFESTIAQVVALAVFLPVLAGQSGNTGCQSLAVAIRGLTLKELTPDNVPSVIAKEALLGFLNGLLVGITAGAGMFVYAHITGAPSPALLGMVVTLALVGSCVASGITGVIVPVSLQRFGADPATASSIFLTTATDIASMGLFLWLATVLVL